jgi:hypothetical protein
MRLLIETRHQLSDPALDAQQHAHLREQVALFSVAATKKVEELREQLATAQAFAATLEEEVTDC